MYCYDFLLTFDQQMRFFIGRKLSTPTILFAALHVTGFLTIMSVPLSVIVSLCEVRKCVFLMCYTYS